MNSKWVGIAIVLSGVAAGCSGGRAIFNVDVFSFLSGSAKDTVPYAAPPLGSVTPPTAAQKITLVPGLASSPIDTVQVSGSANVINQSGGPGTLRFQVYLATDSLGTFSAGRDSLFTPAALAILTAGVDTVPVPLNISNLSPSGNALFSNSAVWIRLAASVSNSGASVMLGKAVLTSLNLRVVVQDKLF
jgi:hypothetical protein